MASSPTYPPYLFNTPPWSEALGWDNPQYYTTIHCADVTGNGQADILARSAAGIVGAYFCQGLGGWLIRLPGGPPLSDRFGYDHPQYYGTIQYADVDGDGRAELIVRRSGGIQTFKLNDPPVPLISKHQSIPLVSSILPSFMTWSALATNDPAWSDDAAWDEAQYYTTIQAADIDGDGKAELLSRTFGGEVVAYKYCATKGSWQQLQAEDPPYWASSEGWDQAEYYATMQTADIDGDGRAELLARSAGGLIAYKYMPTPDDPLVGTWIHLHPTGAPSWPSSEGWDQPSHYTTIQAADIDGDSKAEVVARGPGGIEVYRYTPSKSDPTAGSWTQLETLAHWTDESGGDQRADYATIQCADVDGDGRAEILGRWSDGLEFWKYDSSASNGPWLSLPSLAHWGNASIGYDKKTQKGGEQYYLTIQCADIDGDGGAEVLGRYDDGVEAFKYDSSAQPATWVRVAPHFAQVPFPTFSGEEEKAYVYIGNHLPPQNPDIRSLYDELNENVGTWISQLDTMSPDHQIDRHAWKTVKEQLLSEFNDVVAARTYFSNCHTLLQDTFRSKELTAASVAKIVALSDDQNDAEVAVVIVDVLSGVLNAVGIGTTDEAGVAAGVFASAIGGVMAGLPGGGTDPMQIEVSQLDHQLSEQWTNALAASGYYQEQVLKHWGLLHTLGTLTQRNAWPWPPTFTADAVAAAQTGYATWLYQKLMPIRYRINAVRGLNLDQVEDEKRNSPSYTQWVQDAGGGRYNFYYIAYLGTYSIDRPTTECLDDIWALGVTKADFFLGENGWDWPAA